MTQFPAGDEVSPPHPVSRDGRDGAETSPAGHLGPVVVRPRWLTLRLVERFLLVAPIALVAALGITHRWTSDDGFATLRTVDQLLAGNGPVFNAGQRVEAFISPVWIAVLALGDLVSPSRLEYTAAALSLAAMLGGIVCATFASARLMCTAGTVHSMRLPLGLAAFAALWPVWVWSTGGTEIGVMVAWFGTCALVLARWASTASPTGTPALVVLGLGWIVRPELAAVSAVFVVTVVLLSERTTRRRLRAVLVAAAVPLAYQLFRMGYYGMVTSSASVAREDLVPRPGFGWDYFTDFVSPYLLLVPLVACAVVVHVPFLLATFGARDTRRAAAVAAIAGGGVVHGTLVVVVLGGDAVHARLLVPSVFAMLAPIFVIPATRRHIEALVVTSVWALLCGALMRPPENTAARPFNNGWPGSGLTHEDAGIESRGAQPWMDGPGLYLVDVFEPTGDRVDLELGDPDATIVATGSGTVAYALGTGVHVLDVNGIADPLIGHQRLDHRLVPGHEKSAYAPWLIARFAGAPESVRPDVLTLLAPFTQPVSVLTYLDDVRWAMSALVCPPLSQLQDASESQLTVGHFFANVWDAMSNTSLRYATRPKAVHAFGACGDGVPDVVEDYWEAVHVGPELPDPSADPGVAVVGACDAVILADPSSPDQPWEVVEARASSATIAFDPSRRDRDLAAVFVVGPIGTSPSVVWAETDGAGNARVTQDVAWFPRAEQAWTPIGEERVTVEIRPDLGRQRWVTTVDDLVLAEVPMIGRSDDAGPQGPVLVAAPSPAAPGSTHPSIDHQPGTLSPACRSILGRHAGGGNVPAPDRRRSVAFP